MSENNFSRLPLTPEPDSAIAAIKAFRANKPWQGSFIERQQKFGTLHSELSAAYGVSVAFQFIPIPRASASGETPTGNGGWDRRSNAIILIGKLSVVTYLACFAMACGRIAPEPAVEWAKKIFRRFFPRSYAGCRESRGRLIRDMGLRN